ncbi:MAG: ECF transporter S component [Oscillospiraceae bacterium]|nr:ECF transporter S component [Oscillospiraceae bacterium]
MSNLSKSSLHTRRITITAILLSIALVLRFAATFYLPIYGANGHRINPGTIFAILPAILFGPVYGAIAAGLFDLLGFFLLSTGTFLPWMTVVVTVGGLLRGFLWRGLQGRSRLVLRICILTFAVILLAFGLANMAFLSADGLGATFYDGLDPEAIDTSNMHFISRVLVERTQGASSPNDALAGMRAAVTWGFLAAAGFALLLIGIELAFSKWLVKEGQFEKLLPLTVTILVSGLFVSTLNTFVLQPIFWPAIPIVTVWIPRAVASLLVDTVYVYFVAVLLGLFERTPGLKQLVE